MSLNSQLQRFLEGTSSREDRDAIVRAAIDQARTYLQWLSWKRGYSLEPLGMSIDDTAYDMIAELLSEIDGPEMEKLRTAVSGVLSDTTEDIEPGSALRAVVLRTVRFNLAHFFMEIQPLRARLIRNLRRYVRGSSDLERHDHIAGYWYSLSACDPRLEAEAVPIEQLRAAMPGVHLDGHPVRTVLHALLDTLQSFPASRQAVAETDVVDITAEILTHDHRYHEEHFSEMTPYPDNGVLARETLTAIEQARDWVEKSYVRAGKLSSGEAEAMLAAAERYVADLVRGDAQGHFSYLRSVLPGLTHTRFRSDYRNTYEYILRTIFTSTRLRLESEEKHRD